MLLAVKLRNLKFKQFKRLSNFANFCSYKPRNSETTKRKNEIELKSFMSKINNKSFFMEISYQFLINNIDSVKNYKNFNLMVLHIIDKLSQTEMSNILRALEEDFGNFAATCEGRKIILYFLNSGPLKNDVLYLAKIFIKNIENIINDCSKLEVQELIRAFISYGYVIKLFDEIDEKLFFKMDGNSKLLHLLIILITEKNFFQPKLFKIFCDHFMKIIDTNMGKIIIEKMIKNNNNSFIAKRVKDEIYKNLLPIILDPHNKKIINLFLRRTKLENSHNNAINLFDEIIDCDDLYTENIILNYLKHCCESSQCSKILSKLKSPYEILKTTKKSDFVNFLAKIDKIDIVIESLLKHSNLDNFLKQKDVKTNLDSINKSKFGSILQQKWKDKFNKYF